MDDRELRASLRRLPEARPDEAFTAEVMARVEREERRRAAAGGALDGGGHAGPRWRPTLLAAGLAAAMVAAAGVWGPGWPWSFGGGDGAAAVRGAGGEGGEGGAGGAGGAPAAESSIGGTSSAVGSRPAHQLAERHTPPAEGLPHVPASAPRADTISPSAPAAPPASDFFAAPPPAALPAAERLARLREERERLEARLVAFRSELPPAEPPVVLLGSDEGFDLVFDLGRWAAAPPAGAGPGAVRPAVHPAGQPPRRF